MIIIFSSPGIIFQVMMDLKTHLFINQKKGTDYVHSWKSKAVFNSKLKPLDTTFLNFI